MAASSQFLDLPDEVLVLILERLKPYSSAVSSLARTCHRTHALAEECLYSDLVIKSDRQARAIIYAVQRKPIRSVYMLRLAFVPDVQYSQEAVDLLFFMPRALHNLHHLKIELPYRQNFYPDHVHAWERTWIEAFRDAQLSTFVPKPYALHMLRSCSLNFQNERGRRWLLGPHSYILLHPTLQSLTLINVEIEDQDVMRARHYRGMTMLTELRLEYCDCLYQSLGTLLALPKALERFVYLNTPSDETERWEIRRGLSRRVHFPPPELRSHASSLKHLRVNIPKQWIMQIHEPDSSLATGVEHFDLEHLSVLEEFTLEYLNADNPYQFHPDGTWRSIQRKLFEPHLRESSGLRLPQRPFKYTIMMQTGYIPSREVQDAFESYGRKAKEIDIRLVVIRQTETNNTVAPYLHNESSPERVICYDSHNETGTRTWDFRTEKEVRWVEELARLRATSAFPSINATGDFLLGQLNSP